MCQAFALLSIMHYLVSLGYLLFRMEVRVLIKADIIAANNRPVAPGGSIFNTRCG